MLAERDVASREVLMAADLLGHRALVTGAARRLGRAISLALAQAGCDIVVHYRESSAEAHELAEEIRALGRRAWLLQGTLDNADDGARVFAAAQDMAGALSILVNNASLFPADDLSTLDESHAVQIIRANAFAPLALSSAFAAQGGDGTIVNLLDTTVREYDRTHFSYHLSKRILHTMTKDCALEFAPRVRVNAVAPGAVLAPAEKDDAYLAARGAETPLKAYGNATHIAEAVSFLVRATFITGQVIYVDGGRHLLGGLYD